MDRKIIVITGASDGIGAAAARQLHGLGATVVLVGRSPEKTKRVAAALQAPHYVADFARLDDVRQLAQQLLQDYPRIDVLINNAGGVFRRRELTVDGHEKTLQVNHLAPFLLTHTLMATLLAHQATVINTSSLANLLFGNLDLANLNGSRHFSANHAYGNAKLANILFTKELHRRYHTHGLAAVAVHPGIVATNFASETTSWFRCIYRTPLAMLFMDTPAQGADPLVWLASTTPGVAWIPGAYYARRRPGWTHPQANNPALAQALWEASAALTQTALVP